MSTKGSGGGRRRRTQTEAPGAVAVPEPQPTAAAADTGSIESEALLLDDVSASISAGPGGRGARVGRSFAGAVVGTMLVVGLAFGAALGPGGALGPKDTGDTTAVAGGSGGEHGQDGNGDGKTEAGKGDRVDPEATTKPDGGERETDPTKDPGDGAEPTEKPDVADPTAKPVAPEPTKKPAPEPTPKPTEKPDPTRDPSGPIALELGIRDFHPKLAWGSCDGLDFDVYKVVRSTDSTVTWPAGDGDEVIAAIGPDGDRRAYDKGAPAGAKAWYRVFCVLKGEDGYKVVNASPTKGIEVPEDPTPPDPVSLDIDWSAGGEGKVVLSWEACDVEGFAFYKVVRSTTNDDPSYLPWTDGTEVIGVVEDVAATEWHAWAPDAGQTAWFRVQCLGYVGGMKVLLGETAAVAVTTD